MASQKKFGTFSGVLTPSLLTILGVIMYMRLGSVVGNSSSILQFISIIFFAHLISITTGLSVSSIATDKKIDKGGIYYMLTRSLGLPIGGAIGLTIFIATAFSISLYLIGFSESLIPVINEDWAINGISTNKLRLFGSFALIDSSCNCLYKYKFCSKDSVCYLGANCALIGICFFRFFGRFESRFRYNRISKFRYTIWNFLSCSNWIYSRCCYEWRFKKS